MNKNPYTFAESDERCEWAEQTYMEVSTYAQLLALRVDRLTSVRVTNDEHTGGTNVVYLLWPDGVISAPGGLPATGNGTGTGSGSGLPGTGGAGGIDTTGSQMGDVLTSTGPTTAPVFSKPLNPYRQVFTAQTVSIPQSTHQKAIHPGVQVWLDTGQQVTGATSVDWTTGDVSISLPEVRTFSVVIF